MAFKSDRCCDCMLLCLVLQSVLTAFKNCELSHAPTQSFVRESLMLSSTENTLLLKILYVREHINSYLFTSVDESVDVLRFGLWLG